MTEQSLGLGISCLNVRNTRLLRTERKTGDLISRAVNKKWRKIPMLTFNIRCGAGFLLLYDCNFWLIAWAYIELSLLQILDFSPQYGFTILCFLPFHFNLKPFSVNSSTSFFTASLAIKQQLNHVIILLSTNFQVISIGVIIHLLY